MRFALTSVVTLSLSLLSAAQLTPGAMHKVLVGDGGSLTFNPNNFNAAVGDSIVFEFRAKNHTATQSSFAAPCKALDFNATIGRAGFNSGFNPVPPGSPNFPQFTITVNDTAPIWVYCAQTGHCSQGMVLAINAPTSGNTFAAFEATAKAGGAPPATTPPTIPVSNPPATTPKPSSADRGMRSSHGLLVFLAFGVGATFAI